MGDFPHPAMIPPDDPNIPVWHYMDFIKFVSMLEYSGLLFKRVDLLEDPFEGSLTRPDELAHPQDSNFHSDSDLRKGLRERTMVNCWHMNRNESVAMWKIYAKPGEGIAIQSTYALLRECLGGEVHIGMVSYKNYKTDFTPEENAFYPFMQKRSPFEYERELRAIFQDLPDEAEDDCRRVPSDHGVWKPVNLERLIEHIYVYTDDVRSLPWFRQLVERVAQRYRLDKSVIPSSLVDSEPFF